MKQFMNVTTFIYIYYIIYYIRISTFACVYICVCVYMCIYIHTHMHIHTPTYHTLSNILVAQTIYGNCAMENKHLPYHVSSIVSEYKGRHIIADHFNGNDNDSRPCPSSFLLMSGCGSDLHLQNATHSNLKILIILPKLTRHA